MISALLAALAAAVFAQAPTIAPEGAQPAPVVSTGPAVSVSSEQASGFVEPPPEKKPVLSRPIRVKVHKEAKSWEPVAVKTGGGDPLELGTSFERRIKGKKGLRSKAKSVAHVYPKGEDKVLILSIFPEALKKDRIHVEARLKIVEGFLEEVKVAAVTAEEPAPSELMDTRKLKLAGIDFQEEFPSDAVLTLAAVDPAESVSAVNAGRLKAEFGSEELGLVSLTFMARGVNLKQARKKGPAVDRELPSCPDDARKPDLPLLRARAEEAIEADDYDGAYLSACRAARFGEPASQHLVAEIFRFGYGRRPRDLNLAAQWYARAAAQNYAPSAGALAILYAKADPARAHAYLRQAARLGHGPSQAALGEAFRYGRREERDNVEAYRWYWLAHEKGVPGADRALDELSADMSPMQVEEGRRRASLVLERPAP